MWINYFIKSHHISLLSLLERAGTDNRGYEINVEEGKVIESKTRQILPPRCIYSTTIWTRPVAVSILSIFPHPRVEFLRRRRRRRSTTPPSPPAATFPGTMVLVVTVATHPRDKLENSPRWYCPARNRRAEQNRRAINIRTP